MVLMWIPFLFGGNDQLEVATRYQIGSASQYESQHCLFPFWSGVKCQLAPRLESPLTPGASVVMAENHGDLMHSLVWSEVAVTLERVRLLPVYDDQGQRAISRHRGSPTGFVLAMGRAAGEVAPLMITGAGRRPRHQHRPRK